MCKHGNTWTHEDTHLPFSEMKYDLNVCTAYKRIWTNIYWLKLNAIRNHIHTMRLVLGCIGGKIENCINVSSVINYKNETFHSNLETILKWAVTSRR